MRLSIAKVMVLLGLMVISYCSVVRYRLFRGEEIYQDCNDWQIGAPIVEALFGISDKRLWNDRYYYTLLPIKHAYEDREYVTDCILRGETRIDSVQITLLASKVTIVRRIVLSSDSNLPVINYVQAYSNDPVCFTMDSLTIPLAEDSIRVDFVFRFKDAETNQWNEKPFSFILNRYESTRLGMWGGK